MGEAKHHAPMALLTGFPGFAGQRMLELLVSRGHPVVALVEGPQLQTAKERLLAHSNGAPVEMVEADLGALDLGLSGAEVQRLRRDVQVVFALGEAHDTRASAAVLQRVNVGGTRTLLELALGMTHLSRLHWFGSAFASGSRTGVVRECELERGQKWHSAYERTKAEAEKLCRKAMGRLPLVVLRPGLMAVDSRTGEMDEAGPLYTLFKALVTSPLDLPVPLPARGDHPLHLVPVDYVVQAAYAIGAQSGAAGQTFHLTDPNPLSARQVCLLLTSLVGRRPPQQVALPRALTRGMLRLPGIERYARGPLELIDHLSQFVLYNCANTIEALEREPVRCARFEAYADRIVAWLLRGTTRAPRSKKASHGNGAATG